MSFLIKTKYDFKNALKKSKTDSLWAGEVADVYIDGDANIKIKSSPKKAIKLLKYWENKKDVPEDKKSFVHYRFEKAYQKLGKTKEKEKYQLLHYEYMLKNGRDGISYEYTLRSYLELQINNSVNDKNIVIDEKRFEKVLQYLPEYFKKRANKVFDLNGVCLFRIFSVFSNPQGKYKNMYYAHYISLSPYIKGNINLENLTIEELENYLIFLKESKVTSLKELKDAIKMLIDYKKDSFNAKVINDYAMFANGDNKYLSIGDKASFDLFKKAYDLGYSDAYEGIANHYVKLYKYDELISFLTEHVKKYKKDNKAKIYLADLLFTRAKDDKKMYKKAVEIYEANIKLLTDEQIDRLSKAYIEGLGVDVDINKAKQYSKNTSTAKAILKKELAIFDTLKVKDKMYEEEIKELKQYLTTDDTDKLYKLYAIIRNHKKVYENNEALFKLANLMLEKGKSAKAYNAMANCYMSGSGVEKNEELFEKYCKMAMDLNHADSYNLYYIYLYQKKDNSCIDYLNKAVELGCAAALYNLAQEYMFGGLIEKDEKKAVELLEKALSKEYYTAAYSLGSAYQFGKGVEENQEKAFEYYKIAADKENHPRSCYRVYELIRASSYKLGSKEEAYSYLYRSYINDCDWSFGQVAYAYYRGIVYKKDLKKYLEACKKGFDIGNAYCISEIADLYYYGNDELKYKVDYKKAFELYTMAYEKGNLYSTNKIAEMYINGKGVKVNYDLAYKYAKEALDKNYNRAKWTMAVLYHYGYGVNKDGNKALKLYEEAYKNEKDLFQYDYARLHFIGIEGVLKPNYEMAIKLLKEYFINNPEQDRVPYLIGRCYDNLNDYYNSYKYYKKALDISPKHATYNRVISYYYENGLGTDKDIDKAIKHYEIAHEQEDVYATFRLGMIYRDKENKVYDIDKAIDYLKQAADKGDKDALGFLADAYIYHKKEYKKAYDLLVDADKDNYSICASYADLFYKGYYVPRDYDEAFKWYMKSFELEKTSTIYHRLGRCYFFGHGVKEDKAKAKEYMYISMNEKYKPAIDFYNEFFKNN